MAWICHSLPERSLSIAGHLLPLCARRRRQRGSGFSLVEAMVALAVLTVSSLAFIAAIGVGQRTASLARERAEAVNSVRAYIESMRATYPPSGQTTMAGFFTDLSLPAPPTHYPLKGWSATVQKTKDETGASWSAVVTGSTTPGTAGNAGTIASTDATALGLPRDLDGNGNATSSLSSATIADAAVIIIPVKVTVSWTSGAGGTQTFTIYAFLGQQQ